jgi:hypothetical protein
MKSRLDKMTNSLTEFIARLNALGVSIEHDVTSPTYVNGNECPPSIVLPAKNDSIGCLTIYDDGDELTIEIGELHHTHFSAYNYDADTDYEQLRYAIKAAAQFVADVINDRVLISVDYAGDRCIGSSHRYLCTDRGNSDMVRLPDAPLFFNQATRSERYLWSGPVGDGDRKGRGE